MKSRSASTQRPLHRYKRKTKSLSFCEVEEFESDERGRKRTKQGNFSKQIYYCVYRNKVQVKVFHEEHN